jgi:hypothetical protein
MFTSVYLIGTLKKPFDFATASLSPSVSSCRFSSQVDSFDHSAITWSCQYSRPLTIQHAEWLPRVSPGALLPLFWVYSTSMFASIFPGPLSKRGIHIKMVLWFQLRWRSNQNEIANPNKKKDLTNETVCNRKMRRADAGVPECSGLR